jgi:dihydropyrimidinase
MLTISYDEGVNTGRVNPCKLVQLLSENPAKIFGFYPRKGTIQKGADADLVLFDPNQVQTIQSKTQHSKVSYTVYEGKKCLGMPVLVMQRGKILVENGEMKGKSGNGNFLQTKITKAKC